MHQDDRGHEGYRIDRRHAHEQHRQHLTGDSAQHQPNRTSHRRQRDRLSQHEPDDGSTLGTKRGPMAISRVRLETV